MLCASTIKMMFSSNEKAKELGFKSEVAKTQNALKLRIVVPEHWILTVKADFSTQKCYVKGVAIGKWHFERKDLDTAEEVKKALWYFRKVTGPSFIRFDRPLPPFHLTSAFGYYPEFNFEVCPRYLKEFVINDERWMVHESEKIAFRVQGDQYSNGTKFTRILERHEYGKEPKFYTTEVS